MIYRRRLLEATMQAALQRGKSVLLLGARQTGKSTLAQRFPHAMAVNFMRASALRKYSARQELLEQEIAALPRVTGQLPLHQRQNKAAPNKRQSPPRPPTSPS